MSYIVGVLMNSIAEIKPKKDTTLALMLAAQKYDWQLRYFQTDSLFIRKEQVCGIYQDLTVTDDTNRWFELGQVSQCNLAELDMMLMRQDPPFDMHYIFNTFLLEQAQKKQSLLVINDPMSLRNHNEKLFAADFPQCCPPMLVSAQSTVIKEFIAEQEDVILKPLDAMGGHSIFRVQPQNKNLNVIIETMLDRRLPIMAQRYLPEIAAGDKRIILIDGVAIPYALARIPAANEVRANLAAGGSAKVQQLNKREKWICKQVGETLKNKGIFFAGLDVIGDYLTEINITSPTGIRELEKGSGEPISEQIIIAMQNIIKTKTIPSLQ